MSHELEAELLADFLTETGELVEQLDRDLVELEKRPDGPAAQELLNSVFRALHTVKGAAGFLNLTAITTFAHAAEDAMNRLRKGEVAFTPDVMDALLQSVDVLRQMTAELAAGDAMTPCPQPLIDRLHAISSGQCAATAPPSGESPASPPAAPAAGKPLDLPPSKRDLLPYFIADLRDSLAALGTCIDQPAGNGQQLAELAETMSRTAEFFNLSGMTTLVDQLRAAAGALPSDMTGGQLLRLRAICQLLTQQADALDTGIALDLADDAIERAMQPVESPGPAAPAEAAETDGEPVADRRQGDRRVTDRRQSSAADQTIRVETARLEAILNLVGQLVLNKNRLLGVARRLGAQRLRPDLMEDVISATNELDRLTSDIQVGVMRTRMQPMSKLFDRYPRVIRDIARATGKQIELKMVGRDTEVDKSVLELLGDPLIHILRNSADHGIEAPDVRRSQGKSACGTITIGAQHQGSHVRLEVRDDGKGLNRDVLARKAIEKGLTTAEEVAAMSDAQVFAFIFAPGFSTAEQISDLSGRGVGMDVVRTNVTKLNGTINLHSTPGQGTSVEILIPLTVAIMPAMVVAVGRHLYAIPLTSVVEIVRPERSMLHSVSGDAVMRLRESVLPLIDLSQRLGEPAGAAQRFAVVVAAGTVRAGLLVDRLVGQQEVVIKAMDEQYMAGPFSGATIREDGDVSLILDVVKLLKHTDAGGACRRAA